MQHKKKGLRMKKKKDFLGKFSSMQNIKTDHLGIKVKYQKHFEILKKIKLYSDTILLDCEAINFKIKIEKKKT